MRLTIVVLIAVLVIGGSVIGYGFLINQENDGDDDNNDHLPVNLSPYDKLLNYKDDLEKINQYNQQILNDLEQQIADSEDENLEQLNEEIQVLKRVIRDNTAELEEVIQKLSEINPSP